MKKSTILILALVFLGSVVVVGIFGMQSVPFNERVYIEKITLSGVTSSTGTQIKLIDQGNNKYSTSFINEWISDDQEALILMVDYYLSPADASNKDIDVSVTYVSVTDPVEDVAVINGNQIFIKQPANITIRFTAKDKPNAAKVDLSIVFSEEVAWYYYNSHKK